MAALDADSLIGLKPPLQRSSIIDAAKAAQTHSIVGGIEHLEDLHSDTPLA
jgi:hypothetical protein